MVPQSVVEGGEVLGFSKIGHIYLQDLSSHISIIDRYPLNDIVRAKWSTCNGQNRMNCLSEHMRPHSEHIFRLRGSHVIQIRLPFRVTIWNACFSPMRCVRPTGGLLYSRSRVLNHILNVPEVTKRWGTTIKPDVTEETKVSFAWSKRGSNAYILFVLDSHSWDDL